MRSSKITLALLIVALMLGSKYAGAEELSPPNNTGNTVKQVQSSDVEKLKQDLNSVSSPNPVDTSKDRLSGRVKTLNSKYLLSPGDTMAISVYGEPDFTQPEIIIRPDGYATIEPFGEMSVAGQDVEEFTNNLKAKFKPYLLDPKISVKLSNLHTAKVYIYGAVQKPGLYQQDRVVNNDQGKYTAVVPDLTVASIIANAGGIQYNADLRHIKVTNNETGKNEELDLLKLIENGDVSQDSYLRSGDSIYIPALESDAQISDKDFMLISSSSIAPADFPVRVTGAVSKPGVYRLTSNSPTLNSALAESEGYIPGANKKVITIQRMTPQGNISTFYVDPNKNDLVLRPNDIIVVSDKATSVASKGFDFMGIIMNPFDKFAQSYNDWAEMFDPGRRYRSWQ